MEMKYVKPLKDPNAIKRYETASGYSFSESYKAFVTEFNGGRPAKNCFRTQDGTERVLKSFLSFNADDKETIWAISEWNEEELQGKYVPIALDPAGNLICFDKQTGAVIFLDTETMHCDTISPDFSSLLCALY